MPLSAACLSAFLFVDEIYVTRMKCEKIENVHRKRGRGGERTEENENENEKKSERQRLGPFASRESN